MPPRSIPDVLGFHKSAVERVLFVDARVLFVGVEVLAIGRLLLTRGPLVLSLVGPDDSGAISKLSKVWVMLPTFGNLVQMTRSLPCSHALLIKPPL
jgi:hypothetical protein